MAAALSACGALVGVVTGRGSTPPAVAVAELAPPASTATLLVFVSGAVAHPGLYELASGARIADAIAAAGGLLPTADPGHLPNLAGLVHEGHQVNVPFRKSSAATSARIDVNSAGMSELEEIPGMTTPLAQAIIDTRTTWGPFSSLSDMRTRLGLDTGTTALIGKHLSFITTSS